MLELLTVAEMREADRLAIEGGVAGITLMENAGRAVADAVCARFDASAVVCICAGPGNNGGDGLIAARLLRERGYSVRLLLLGEPERLKGDARVAAERYGGPCEPVDRGLGGARVVVDALFGAGLDRPVTGEVAALVGRINASDAAVIAVDLPSGVNGDTGAILGLAVRAQATVTFFRRKLAHLLLPGRLQCGRVEVADIGVPPSVLGRISPLTYANEPPLWLDAFPVPRPDGHKYNRGHTVVVSGGMASTGAARLAARAALRAGSGLVTIASPREALPINAVSNLAVMVCEAEGADGLAGLLQDQRFNTVVLGPGGGVGAEMRAKVRAALGGGRSVVLDADALTSFVDSSSELLTLLKGARDSAAILTPHRGEFSRLFNNLMEGFPIKQKLEEARHASHETGSILVLKGADTVVAAPNRRAAIAGNAPPYLATAGSGDVLAGIIAGLCAQGMPPFEAAAAAVWMHGEAAADFGPGLIAEDLPDLLPAVCRGLYNLRER